MEGSVLHTAACTEEAMQVLRPANEDVSIVREKVLSIRTVQGSVNLMTGPIHCL